MNKIYRIVWSTAHQAYVVAAETAKARGKSASTVTRTGTTLACALIAQQAFAAPAPDALPTGGQVVAGQASITQSGAAMNIQQGSDKAILNWQSFNIGANASVNFQQPGSSSIALNRVIGSDASAIYGSLTANGQVFLVNPNGVLFGQGARVDVGGLVASTLGIRNEDFLAGNYRFTRDGAAGSVVNQGELYGKYIALLAPEAINDGVIAARQGTVALAAGDAVALNISGDRLIDVVVDSATIDTLVENRHLVQADDGTVFLSAQSANTLLGQVVNSGAVEAQGIVNDGGVVRLLASSNIEHSGTINVDGGTSGNGGTAILLASLSNPDSLTDVSGTISARGGSEAGNGGFVETSAAHVKIQNTVRVDTRAPKGTNGQWLIDPTDYTVAAVGGDIDGATLSANLELGDVTIDTAGVGGNGDIFINDTVSWVSGSALNLEADRNIEINASMSFGDFFGFPQLQITYGIGGSGKAVIKQGVDWSGSGAGSIFDNTNFQITAPGAEDTSRDFYIGTKNVDIYVQLNPGGSGVYGETNLPWDYYDAPGGNLINLNSTFGNVNWSTAVADRTVDGAGPTYALSYVDGLTSDYYTGFAAGNAVNWTVTPRPIELTANDRTKTYGDTLVLGTTAYSVSAGSLVSGDTIDSVTLTSAGAVNTAAVNTYGIAITGTTGSGNFNSSNYTIATVDGTLTVGKATLTYVADAQNITAGDAIPDPLTGNVTGFVNGEDLATATTGTLAFSTTATSSSPAAKYAINGSGLLATNYTFVQAAGNATALTINASIDLNSVVDLVALLLKNDPNRSNAVRLSSGLAVFVRSGQLAGWFSSGEMAAEVESLKGEEKYRHFYLRTSSGLASLTKQHCPNCSFSLHAYRDWMSGGSGAAGTTFDDVWNRLLAKNSNDRAKTIQQMLQLGYTLDEINATLPKGSMSDVWKLQYKAALDSGKSPTDAQSETVKAMIAQGYTAKDFKAAGISLGSLITRSKPEQITENVTRGATTGTGSKSETITTATRPVSYVQQTSSLPFTDAELLEAGYSQSELDTAKTQVKNESATKRNVRIGEITSSSESTIKTDKPGSGGDSAWLGDKPSL
ncbi:MAG: filamentous hemagglutinin N-terminal domain-containing protein [Pseudomonadota bacterium]